MRINEALVRRARIAFDHVITDLAHAADPDSDAGVTADTCANLIKIMIMNLPPDEGDRLLELMDAMVKSGDPELAVNMGGMAGDRPARVPGMDRGLAMDRGARGRQTFAEMFGAGRIG